MPWVGLDRLGENSTLTSKYCQKQAKKLTKRKEKKTDKIGGSLIDVIYK